MVCSTGVEVFHTAVSTAWTMRSGVSPVAGVGAGVAAVSGDWVGSAAAGVGVGAGVCSGSRLWYQYQAAPRQASANRTDSTPTMRRCRLLRENSLR